jgi:hypothetical protein
MPFNNIEIHYQFILNFILSNIGIFYQNYIKIGLQVKIEEIGNLKGDRYTT